MQWRPRPATVVLCVIALAALPTLLRLAMQPMLGATLWFPTYYPAILVAGLLLDWRAALSVLLLCALTADLLFVSSQYGTSLSVQSLVSIGVFMLAAGLILLVATGIKLARRKEVNVEPDRSLAVRALRKVYPAAGPTAACWPNSRRPRSTRRGAKSAAKVSAPRRSVDVTTWRTAAPVTWGSSKRCA